jgi:energy-coupling factor transporter ATP-binding protein EcfA2
LSGSVDYGVVFEFASLQAFESYVAHDLHQQLKNLVASLAESRQHVQFAVD